MPKKSQELKDYLLQQSEAFHAALESAENTLSQKPQEKENASATLHLVSKLASDIDQLRIKNNIAIVKNTLTQMRLLLERMDLLITYRETFEEEDSPDQSYTEIQIMNERNAFDTAREYSAQLLMTRLKGKITEKDYRNHWQVWSRLNERDIEMSAEDYKGEKSGAIEDPVLQYARDTQSYITTLIRDVRNMMDSITQEVETIDQQASNLPLMSQASLTVFVDQVREDFAAAQAFGENIANEIEILEKFIRDVKKFNQPHVAPYVRGFTADS